MRYLILLISLFPWVSQAQVKNTDAQQIQSVSQLLNGGFENGKTTWAASGGTFLTTMSSPMVGAVHATWDSNGAAQTLRSPQMVVREDIGSKDAVAVCLIKVPSGTATHTIGVYDGTNLLATRDVTSSTSALPQVVNFVSPEANGSNYVQVQITSVDADEPLIAVDDCKIVPALGFNVGSDSGITAWQSYTPVFTGFGSVTASQFFWRQVGANVEIRGSWTCATSTATLGRVSLPNSLAASSSITRLTLVGSGGTGAGATAQMHLYPIINGSNDTVTFGPNSSAAIVQQNGSSLCTSGNVMSMMVSIPIQGWENSGVTFTPDVLNWKLDLNISGAHVDLGTSNQASYVAPNDGSLTMTVNSAKGSASAGISCSATNDNSVGSTTCSAGNEELGFVANFPRAGLVEVCYSFSHFYATGTGTIQAAFQAIRTANGSQTIVEEGGSRTSSGSTGSSQVGSPQRYVCGTFQIPSAAKHTVRLMYEQTIAATITSNLILADASASIGQRDVKITARYIDQQTPAPLLVNSVISNSSGIETVNRVNRITTCTADPCAISSQSGLWVSSITRHSTGNYSINFAAGYFSAAPTCVAQGYIGTSNPVAITDGNVAPTTSSFRFTCARKDTEAVDDCAFGVICMGPR